MVPVCVEFYKGNPTSPYYTEKLGVSSPSPSISPPTVKDTRELCPLLAPEPQPRELVLSDGSSPESVLISRGWSEEEGGKGGG